MSRTFPPDPRDPNSPRNPRNPSNRRGSNPPDRLAEHLRPHRDDEDLGNSLADHQHLVRRRKAALRNAGGDDQSPIHHLGDYLAKQSPAKLATYAATAAGLGLGAAVFRKPLFKLAKTAIPLARAASKLSMAYTVAQQRHALNEEQDH